VELLMKSFRQFMEDGMGGGAVAAGPTNTAGGGQVAGIGVGPKGEPGVDLRKKKRNDPRLPMGIGRRKAPVG
jgi:hypothetical protein